MEQYSLSWFQQRAISSLRKISDGTYDFSDSLLLYAPGADEEYEKAQQEDSPYHKEITAPERVYLQHIARDIVAQLPHVFEYVDLGPGSEHKEQILFDEIKHQKKKCVYMPVDISRKFLDMAINYAIQQGTEVSPMHASFEELPELLQEHQMPRFVSLGLTYSNYNPQEILPLLANISGKDGYAFINSQIRERINIHTLVEIYGEDILPMATAKLALLELDSNTDITDLHADDAIQVWCTLRRITPELALVGLNPGDKLLVFQSLRPTMQKLTADLKASPFHTFSMFDIGSPFVGALLHSPIP